MLVKYCNIPCQQNHWAKHKKMCKHCATKLPDKDLFKNPPPKEDCPICFLPMPGKLVCCVSLPPTTIFSVSVYDGAIANEKLAEVRLLIFAGKAFVKDVLTPVFNLEMMRKCPLCNSDRDKTEEVQVEV